MKRLRPFVCVSLLLAASALSASAEDAVLSVQRQPNQVTVTIAGGQLELRPVDDRSVRVRFSDGKTAETPGFVLKEGLAVPSFTVKEDPSRITVATAQLQAVVDRATGALSFQDAQGRVFLTEQPGGRVLQPVTLQGKPSFSVGQTFQSPDSEKLYGLGQYQDGLWNWRGIPVEMRQLNTQIAIPVLVSNKGYGLLWDNASRTDFNLPGDPVALSAPSESTDSLSPAPTATEQLSSATKAPAGKGPFREGSYTTGEAGDYVFCVRDADRSNDVAILLDGRQIAGVTNRWTPRAVVGKATLPASTKVALTVRGGGKDVKLFARPLGNTSTFRSDYGQAIDYTVFYGPALDDVIASYRNATGPAPLWPKWAFGLWQCRERYSSSKQLLDTAAEFRRRGIPVDLIIQDWQYWGPHGWGSYEWDEKPYPNPADLIKGLHDLNFKFMISVWCNPHGKTGEALKAGNALVGEWIDVFSATGRDIRWKYLNEAFFSIGTDGWWGDATEPGDPGTALLGKPLSIGAGDQFTNAYPLFASRSLYEGQRATSSDKRVVTLTRSAFPGQQRYAAASWSGDINGDWETFRRQIPAGLNVSLTGQPYWTTDCAGFFHPGDQYKSADFNELLVRWFQWSTFCPILRVHGFKTETEMWKWLPDTQEHLLAYDRLRYRLLPYNYSVASRVTFQNDTFMRPLGMDFPQDPKAWDVADQYLFGPAFLVSPVTQPQATSREVYLPAGARWVNFWTGQTQEGGQAITVAAPLAQMPLLVRAGSIVPFGPDVQYANEKSADPIELRVYPGADGSFTLYEDEGDGYGYEKGSRAAIPFTWNDRTRTLTIGPRQGEFPGMLKTRTFRIVLVASGAGTGIEPAAAAVEVPYDGRPVEKSLATTN
jgi:alpha-D-xyloside xylohydrolase